MAFQEPWGGLGGEFRWLNGYSDDGSHARGYLSDMLLVPAGL